MFSVWATENIHPYLLLLFPQPVPHGSHDLGDVSEGGVGILSLDGCLGVSEEEGIGRDGLGGLIGILLLLLLLGFGLGLHHVRRRSLLSRHLKGGSNWMTQQKPKRIIKFLTKLAQVKHVIHKSHPPLGVF